MDYIALARKLRPLIEKAALGLDDRDASLSAELFPRMKYDGALIEAGTRINWRGTVKAAAAALWDTEQNDPDNAPNLWADIGFREGERVIPQVLSAAGAFAAGEKGWWGESLMISLIDGNVWTPAQYPQGWIAAE